MGYIKEFQERLQRRDFSKVLQLWQEYLTVDTTDADELLEILKEIQASELHQNFGDHVESALPMWQSITDKEKSYEVLKTLFDLQTTNSPQLADLSIQVITDRHGNYPHFKEGLRLVGLRDRQKFQGALSNFDLLTHMDKGQFVYHTAGWGTGEILDMSLVREQLSIEFENVGGVKDLSFSNAFKTLKALSKENFLAKRFANADLLEAQAKKDPLGVIKLLLTDLGPQNAQEIKDQMYELVIPEKEWAKWWQGVRVRLKKDPIIETPNHIKEPYRIRDQEKSVRDHLVEVQEHVNDLEKFIPAIYAFIRDVPNALKDQTVKKEIEESLIKALKDKKTSPENGLQLSLFLEQYLEETLEGYEVQRFIKEIEHPEALLEKISIIALKKRVLEAILRVRSDWAEIFLMLLFTPQVAMIREYLANELYKSQKSDLLEKKLLELVRKPQTDPETFFWYFQRLLTKKEMHFSTPTGRGMFFESLLTLLSSIELNPEYKELTRKIYQLISGKRYEVVRHLIEGMDRDYLQEFLLLASKCHTLTSHDQKILKSLAAVVDPSFKGQDKTKDRLNTSILWTTKEGLDETKKRIEQIGTVEVVDNAKEIEEARALGDLRENSEFKYALERRARLQGDLKRLSDLIQKARIITEDDIDCDEIGVGNRVKLIDSKGEEITFTILGPWDAKPDQHILSSQSQLAQEMMGKKVGDSIQFKNEEFQVQSIESFL